MRYPPVTTETKWRAKLGVITRDELVGMSSAQVRRIATMIGVKNATTVKGGKDALIARIFTTLRERHAPPANVSYVATKGEPSG